MKQCGSLRFLPKGDDEGEYTHSFRLGLVRARLDLIKGRVYSHADVKRRFGKKQDHWKKLDE